MAKPKIPVIESQRRRFLIGYHMIDGFGVIKKTGAVELVTSSHLFGEPFLLYEVMEATGYLKDPDFNNPKQARLEITSICPIALDLVTSTEEEKWQAWREKNNV